MFKFDKTENGYIARVTEKIAVERVKEVDSLILGEIRKIASDNEIETRIILNEKNVAEALRNYQDGYKRVKADVAREIIDKIESVMFDRFSNIMLGEDIRLCLAELKKKYVEGEPNGQNIKE